MQIEIIYTPDELLAKKLLKRDNIYQHDIEMVQDLKKALIYGGVYSQLLSYYVMERASGY